MQKWGLRDREGKRIMRLLLQLPEIPEENRKIVEDFMNELEAISSAKVTIRQYLEGLIFAGKIIDFETATKRDVMKVVVKIERSENSPQTKMMRKAKLKKFFKWLRGYADGYPPEVSWFKTTLANNKRVLPDDLLTPEEIEKLISVAIDIRTKALVATLYDTGCRASELLTMRVKDITFDEYSAITRVHGKTGARRVRAIFATSYLQQWLESHPLGDDPDAPLWIKLRKTEHLGYDELRNVLKALKTRAAIKKRIYPHLFRHTAATEKAQWMTEAQMKIYFGWGADSTMPGIYVHLSGRDVDDALLDFYKLKKAEKEKKLPKKCPVCHETNPPGAELCWKCYRPLDLEKHEDLKNVMKELIAITLSDKPDREKLLKLMKKI